jgi:L-fuconolactonase
MARKENDMPEPQAVFGHVHVPNEQWLARATPEAPLELDLPIVDPHLHLWHFGGGTPYFLPDYARDLAVSGHRVEASVFVECSTMYRADGPEHLKPVGETEFAVGQAAMAASGKYTSSRVAAGIVAFADLTLGDRTRERLEAHLKAANGRLRGIRHRAKWDRDPVVKGPFSSDKEELYLEPAFGRGIDLLTSLGLSFDASVFHP